MTSLSDAERDACDVMQALAGLAALLRRPGGGDLPSLDQPSLDQPSLDQPHLDQPDAEQARQLLLGIADDAGLACERVVAYLRQQRGPGDGELVAVPRQLGMWREWTPERGYLFGVSATVRRANGVPQHRRSDPGE